MNSPMLEISNFGFQDCSNGHSWGPGIRNQYIIHYVIKGCGFYERNGTKYRVNTGESFIIMQGDMVYYYPDMSDPWTYAWIDFIGGDAREVILKTAFSDYPVCPAADLSQIYRMFTTDSRSRYASLRNDGILRLLLSEYIKLYPSAVISTGPDYLHIAKTYIAANCYRSDFSVGELAAAVGIERSYLYRLFYEKACMSIISYIIEMRLENAKRMLDDGVNQIKLVAYSVGYSDPLYFSNAFKKKYGLSPKNYINSLNQAKA